MSARKKDAYSGEVFSISFRGYNREDVNEYIARIDDERAEETEALRADKRALEARAIAAEARIDELVSEAEEHRAESDRRLAQLDAKIAALEADLAAAQKRAAEIEEEAKSRKTTEEGYTAVENAELEELRRKAALYDKLESSLGSSFANATIAANTIVSAAEEEAAKIRAQAQEELNSVRDAIRRSAGEAIEDICVLIGKETVGRLDGMLKRIKQLESDTEDLAGRLDGELWQAKTNIAYIKASLEAEILKRLALIAVNTELSPEEAGELQDSPETSASEKQTSAGSRRAPARHKSHTHRPRALRGLSAIFRLGRK